MPWKYKPDFVRQVVTLAPMGHFMFAGSVLTDMLGKNHIRLDIAPADSDMVSALKIVGQGKMLPSTLHSAGYVAYFRALYGFDHPAEDQRKSPRSWR